MNRPAAGSIERLASLQILRAVAAWLVVIHHFWQSFFNLQCGNPFTCFVAERGSVGVDMFFVVSGFVMVVTTHGRHMTPRAFAAKRVARIVPAYWVWTGIVAALALALPGGFYPYAATPSASIVQSALLSMFFVPHVNPSGLGLYPLLTVGWSLNYEMLFYAVFAASLVLRGWRQIAFVVAMIIALATFWPWRLPFAEFMHNTQMWEFLYGVLLGCCFATRRLPTHHVAGALAILAGVAAIALFSPYHRGFNWGVASLLIVYGLLCFEDVAGRLPFLVQLGDLSYSTYLAHAVVLFLLKDLYTAMGRDDLWPAFLLASIIAIHGLSLLSHRMVESRMSRPLQRLLARPVPATAPFPPHEPTP